MTEGPSEAGRSLAHVLEQLALPGWRGFTLLRRHRADHAGPARVLGRQLRSVAWTSREDFESRCVRFAFVSDGSTANLEDALLLESLDRGVIPVQFHGTSRQASRELRDPGSELHSQRPQVVIVLTSPDGAAAGEADAFVDSLVEDLRAFRARSEAVLVVHTLVPPESRPLGLSDWREKNGLAEACARANSFLVERCREIPDVQVVDLGGLVALSGARWWTLHRSWFLAHARVPEDLASVLGRDYAAIGAALRGLTRKCLVLDLDDTLWGGVVGEAGVDRVQVGDDYPGNVFRAIQKVALQLHERGVVLALNSQNEEEDGWAPFRRRPEMALKPEHFAASRINWTDKVTNLRALAAELRLGLDSFVMLDNDRVQGAWVEDQLPEVYVIPAYDPLDMLRALATQRLFDGLGRTAEDALRTRSYVAASRRREEEATAADRETFLAGLRVSVSVGRASSEQVPRLAQLAQRTNQFNLTTRRYTEGQIRELCAAEDAEVLYCSCRDRFADEGIIGLAILRTGRPEWEVDTLLLSCRVLSWGVEKALAAAVARLAVGGGATALRGEYVRSAKNGIAERFYPDLGFSPLPSEAGGSWWRLPLPPSEIAPSWIDLHLEWDAH
jgi:FkbH-like protein